MPHINVYGDVTVTIGGCSYHMKNTVVKTGADITSWLLAGNPEYMLQHVYIAFYNDNDSPPIPPSGNKDYTVSIFHNLTSPSDALRAPILKPIHAVSTNTGYTRNKLRILSVTDAIQGVINNLECKPANNSKLYMLGIVASPGATYMQDILYAYAVMNPIIPVTITGQVSIAWDVTITV